MILDRATGGKVQTGKLFQSSLHYDWYGHEREETVPQDNPPVG